MRIPVANIRRYLKNKHIVLFVTITFFVSCKNENIKVINTRGIEIPLTDSLEKNTAIDSLIIPYRQGMEERLDQVLTYNPEELTKKDKPLENKLTNWFADTALQQAGPVFSSRTKDTIDFCLLNYGGIRAGLPKGSLTVRQVFEIMPFENELVAVRLKAPQVEALINYLVKAHTAHPISGLRILLNRDKSLKNFSINQKPIDNHRDYWVLTNDYLLNGGDNMWFFSENEEVVKLDYKVRNALIDKLTKSDTLRSAIDGRFAVQQ